MTKRRPVLPIFTIQRPQAMARSAHFRYARLTATRRWPKGNGSTGNDDPPLTLTIVQRAMGVTINLLWCPIKSLEAPCPIVHTHRRRRHASRCTRIVVAQHCVCSFCSCISPCASTRRANAGRTRAPRVERTSKAPVPPAMQVNQRSARQRMRLKLVRLPPPLCMQLILFTWGQSELLSQTKRLFKFSTINYCTRDFWFRHCYSSVRVFTMEIIQNKSYLNHFERFLKTRQKFLSDQKKWCFIVFSPCIATKQKGNILASWLVSILRRPFALHNKSMVRSVRASEWVRY